MENRDLDIPTIDTVAKIGVFASWQEGLTTKYSGRVNGKVVTKYCDTSLEAYHLALKWAYKQGYDVLCRE